MDKKITTPNSAHTVKRTFWHDTELEVLDSVYEPREDSFLLAEALQRSKGTIALDMGCGCGIQSIAMALRGASVTAVDINPEALENTRKNAGCLGLSDRISVKKSNLFTALKGKRFDLIAFNPPYLPSEGKQDIALDGGPRGKEVIHKFLDKLPFYLKKNGECFIVASSLNEFSDLPGKAIELGFSCMLVASKKLFFEEIAVFRLC